MAEKGVRIRIISESVGKGFKDANKALSGLNKAVGLLGVSLSAASVIKFGKDSVKAFAENEKSAKRLAGVVKNLGQAFETPLIEQNLDQISAKFGYQGEVLREAYQKLLTATGSVTKSNELLNASLDIAAGSGQDLVSVNQDLAALYVGNTKGLKKYNLGLSQADLKTLDFEKGLALLTKTFKGAAGEELTTYSGKMRVLAEAAGNAQEIIGKSLTDSLTILSGEGNTIQPLADAMADLATYTGEVITGLATMIAEFKKLPGVEKYITDIFPKLIEFSMPGQVLDVIRKFGNQTKPGMSGYPSSALGGTFIDPNQAKRDAIEKERLKREKERLALEKKGAAEAKKRAALDKAARTLELDRINLTAGLKGQISETDRLSLNLQLALLDKNDAAATKLASQLDAAVKRQNELAALLLATPQAPNPFEAWKIPDDILNWSAASLGVSKEMLIKDPGSIERPDTDALRELLDAWIDGEKASQAEARAQAQAEAIVKLYIDGEELTSSITKTQTNQSLSGSFNQVNRSSRFENIAV